MTSLIRHSYYIYPKAIDRIETAPHSRKFPVVLYDIREIETIRVCFWMYFHCRKIIQSLSKLIFHINQKRRILMNYLHSVKKKILFLLVRQQLWMMILLVFKSNFLYSLNNHRTLKSSSNDPNLSYNGTYTTITVIIISIIFNRIWI